jgi:hypothetical protein
MTNNNVLNLVSQTLKTNNKLAQIKNKKAMYQKDLQDLQTKYLVEFNKTQNDEELKKVQDNLNQEMIQLSKKYLEENKEDKKQEA